MHRDPTLVKRNALIIPGVLLVLVCLAGILYAQTLRSDDVECEDARLVVFAGACRSATLLLAFPILIGAFLIGLGARLRSGESCHLGHGTAATTGLAVLIAVTALPALAAIGVYLTQDPDSPSAITYGDTDYGFANLLGALAGLTFVLVLLPYLLLYIGTARAPRCCREKACFEPCFCDEDDATTAMAPTSEVVPTGNDNAQVTTSTWTGAPARELQPLPPAPIQPAQQGALLTRAPPETTAKPAARVQPKAKPGKKTRKVTRKAKA